jgi:hypothetical protein
MKFVWTMGRGLGVSFDIVELDCLYSTQFLYLPIASFLALPLFFLCGGLPLYPVILIFVSYVLEFYP